MKAILGALSLSALLSSCGGGAFQTAGEYEPGKQALYEGNYPRALSYFQKVAQANPQAVSGATRRLGVVTYLAQAQDPAGSCAEAGEALRKELSVRYGAWPK